MRERERDKRERDKREIDRKRIREREKERGRETSIIKLLY